MSIDLRNNRGEMHSDERSPHLDPLGLLSRAQTGDPQAFAVLVEPHQRRIYAAAMSITRNHEDAEDACQESMMKAFVHIQRFQCKAKFSTWLTRIVINEALMTVRKTQMESRYRSNVGGPFGMPFLLENRDENGPSDPEALCAQAERRALLWEAISCLETKSRSAVCMLELEEKETSEIAEKSQLSRSGVRSRLQRALRKLRAMLADKLGGSMPLTAREYESQE